jgi:hypothetical protein
MLISPGTRLTPALPPPTFSHPPVKAPCCSPSAPAPGLRSRLAAAARSPSPSNIAPVKPAAEPCRAATSCTTAPSNSPAPPLPASCSPWESSPAASSSELQTHCVGVGRAGHNQAWVGGWVGGGDIAPGHGYLDCARRWHNCDMLWWPFQTARRHRCLPAAAPVIRHQLRHHQSCEHVWLSLWGRGRGPQDVFSKGV